MVTWVRYEILLSTSVPWWFPPYPLFLVLNFNITWKHKVKLLLSISPCHDQESTPSTAYTEYCIHRVLHTLSTAYTEYCIHRVLHTPSTAYTEYCIHRVLHHPKIDYLALPASLSSRGWRCCTQLSTFPQLKRNQWIESQLPSRLPPKLPPPDWLPPGTPPTLLDHGL